jgi:CDP-glycerol glycerophosphotransferase (TagB/SpsB family)
MRKGQKTLYLSHGTALKSVKSYYTIPNRIDYCIVASKNVVDLQAYEFNFDKTRMIPLGFPRNDVFAKQSVDVKQYLNTSCQKVIVWYPTFRRHKNGLTAGSGDALPIIHNAQKAQTLNNFAKEHNVLIVLKPHFAQDTTYIKNLDLSNIRFIDDAFFIENKISSYEFVGGCDALITDYSSIYFDFLLCDKPIAAVWEDIEDYKRTPGLIDNYEHYMRGAEKVYNLDELEEFVFRISRGEDILKSERNEVMREVNLSTDGRNSERVVDFIMSNLHKNKHQRESV